MMSIDEAADILGNHQVERRGMTSGAPDVCTCGTETWPLASADDVMIRRNRAFARHQAEVLARGE